MEDPAPPSPKRQSESDTGNESADEHCQTTHPQGVQLLPLLKTYFKTAGLLLLVWLVGYFGFSSSWLIIGLFFHVASEEYKKIKHAKRAYAQHAMHNEKQAILARVDELPSWVSTLILQFNIVIPKLY